LGVFRGCIRKECGETWIDGGKNVVKCVVNVVTGRLLIRSWNCATNFVNKQKKFCGE
jgi:hypothetical protein